MDKQEFFLAVKNELIVSCQALKNEPLHGADIMVRMALAAQEGGAKAIRANGKEDVIAIKGSIGLPVIGLVKRDYADSDIYITPTQTEIDELIEAGADVIALDATNRRRPKGVKLEELFSYIRENSDCLIMADISTVEEGVNAWKLGVDMVSTTLSGYTPYSPKLEGPDFELIERLVSQLDIPVIAEGRIQQPEEALQSFACGAYSVVVGSAITRPQILTRRFVDAIERKRGC